MNKYKVKVSHIFSEVLDVEADTEEAAKEIAEQEIKKEDRNSNIEYETTVPSEHWPVISEEKLKELMEQFEAANAKPEEETNIITPNLITP
jgi:hypothetical protein